MILFFYFFICLNVLIILKLIKSNFCKHFTFKILLISLIIVTVLKLAIGFPKILETKEFVFISLISVISVIKYYVIGFLSDILTNWADSNHMLNKSILPIFEKLVLLYRVFIFPILVCLIQLSIVWFESST